MEQQNRWQWVVLSLVTAIVALGISVAGLQAPVAEPFVLPPAATSPIEIQFPPIDVNVNVPFVGPEAPADVVGLPPAVEERAVERIGVLCSTESGNCVESWNGSDIVVYSDAGSTQKFLVDGATGNTTVAGTLAVTGLQGGWSGFSAQTAISLTEGAIITPTGTYQPLTSASAVTTSATTAIAAGTAGNLLILRNANAADEIIIDGTGGTVECKANVTLGAQDILVLMYTGADWNCVSSYDNS